MSDYDHEEVKYSNRMIPIINALIIANVKVLLSVAAIEELKLNNR